ncbi:hypothetical protein AB0O20_06735 [Streptomyces kronopolitis]|uniref:hypothetical protein n=1 Tax=Streptomyces kronopolitis TaxID=1612435 RepID=UPI0034313FC4
MTAASLAQAGAYTVAALLILAALLMAVTKNRAARRRERYGDELAALEAALRRPAATRRNTPGRGSRP